jgi:hypothetical protein
MMQTLLLVLGAVVVGFLAGRLQGTPGNVRYVRVQPPPVNDAVPAPGASSRMSAMFVRELVGLADRLAARDVYVRKLACEPYWFWELVAQPGADVHRGESVGQTELTRVFWNGKGFDLSIDSAPLEAVAASEKVGPPPPGLSGAQLREYLLKANPWNHELRTKVGRTGDAIGAAEDLLIRRFSGSAGMNPGPA